MLQNYAKVCEFSYNKYFFFCVIFLKIFTSCIVLPHELNDVTLMAARVSKHFKLKILSPVTLYIFCYYHLASFPFFFPLFFHKEKKLNLHISPFLNICITDMLNTSLFKALILSHKIRKYILLLSLLLLLLISVLQLCMICYFT